MGKPMKIVVVLGQNVSPSLAVNECAHAYVIGVDAGALYCVKNGIAVDEAIGDFDSISQSAFLSIISSGAKIKRLPIEKDETDTEYALSLFPHQEMLVLGGMHGKRIEHAMANFSLLAKFPKAVFLDDYSKAFFIKEGQEMDVMKERYRFFSVFPLSPLTLEADGLHYPYPEVLFGAGSLGVSNEFTKTIAHIKAVKGSAVIILSRDDGVEN